jgi:phage regulator Rha-like protein
VIGIQTREFHINLASYKEFQQHTQDTNLQQEKLYELEINQRDSTLIMNLIDSLTGHSFG